jgi:hypothetical protein
MVSMSMHTKTGPLERDDIDLHNCTPAQAGALQDEGNVSTLHHSGLRRSTVLVQPKVITL